MSNRVPQLTYKELAKKYLNIQYLDSGRNPKMGLDCWGLVLNAVYDIYGIVLPDTSYHWQRAMQEQYNIYKDLQLSDFLEPVTKPKYGDIILVDCFLRNLPIHAGICLTSSKFIHCSKNTNIVITPFIRTTDTASTLYRIKNDIPKI